MMMTPDLSRWLVALSILLVGLVVVIAIAASLAPALLPAGDQMGREGQTVAAGVVFVGSYLALAIGRIPGLSIDRAGIALVGAGLMVVSGALSLDDAYHAVDLDTITLLLGMMIVVASLRLSGFFAIANAWVMAHARRPLILLGAVVATSGVFSAFLVNDAICLVLAPLVLELMLALGRRPVPPAGRGDGVECRVCRDDHRQSTKHHDRQLLSYPLHQIRPGAGAGRPGRADRHRGAHRALHRAEFAGAARLEAAPPKVDFNRVLVIRALLATVIMIALFFAGIVPAKAAIIIGGLLLLTRRVKSRRVYSEIDWSLLLMFAGLFIIVAGAQHALLGPDIIASAGRLHLDQVPVLSAVTAVLSNLVSNVPAVLMLKPFVDGLNDHDTAWLVIAMASTLAGNFTVLGSIANLIVVQRAAVSGVAISFWDYFRVGAPLTIITLAIGTLWLWR
jgi:Na+/H+ antiporter NhaD/arsenite permease-like protein